MNVPRPGAQKGLVRRLSLMRIDNDNVDNDNVDNATHSNFSTPREKVRLGSLPLLGENIEIDDEDVEVVLVFPRELAQGGIVDPDQIIADPMTACRSIFLRPQNPKSADTMYEADFGHLSDRPITAAVYQTTVRAGVMHVLLQAGLSLKAFSSIDEDEIFVKISLPLEGELIRRLAQRYKYKLPFRKECAVQGMLEEQGSISRGRSVKDFEKNNVPAYLQYDADIAHSFEEFRHIDAIRIVYQCVDEWLDLAQMVKQKIIIRHFPAARYEQVKKLNEVWSNLGMVCKRPNHEHEDVVKDYFGERITFHFHWLCFYTKMLLPLGILGFLCALRRMRILDLSLETQRYIQVVFSFILCGWAAIFNEMFKRKAARSHQRWGMKDWDTSSPDRPEYEFPTEDSKWRLYFCFVLSKGFVVIFCAGFAVCLVSFEYMAMQKKRAGDESWDSYRRSFIVVSVQLVSWIWGKFFATAIVRLQNHRTESRYDDALSWTLATVKLFVAIFPFFNIAFLKEHLEPICPPTGFTNFTFAVWEAYGTTGWPIGIPVAEPMRSKDDIPVDGALAFLDHYRFQNSEGQHCLLGCYPAYCEDGAACVTTCTQDLEYNLLTVYIAQVVATVFLYLVCPIFLVKVNIWMEITKVKASAAGYTIARYTLLWLCGRIPRDTEAATDNLSGGCRGFSCITSSAAGCSDGTSSSDEEALQEVGPKHYTFMQFQSKCAEVAPYEYYSWGGSSSEDFMDVTVGFALLTCFGIHLPIMAFIALICHVIEYRLTAYRMTNVTCRPMPDGGEGIGVWQSILERISDLAIILNVASAVFVMHPMRSWSLEKQLVVFIVLEHLLLLLRNLIQGIFTSQPCDVQRVDDLNAYVTMQFLQKKVTKYFPVIVEHHNRQDSRSIDVSLGPSSVDMKNGVL